MESHPECSIESLGSISLELVSELNFKYLCSAFVVTAFVLSTVICSSDKDINLVDPLEFFDKCRVTHCLTHVIILPHQLLQGQNFSLLSQDVWPSLKYHIYIHTLFRIHNSITQAMMNPDLSGDSR